MTDNSEQPGSPPKTRVELMAQFDALGIGRRTVEHKAVFTVAESTEIKASMPGGHSKNLFLKDKKGALYLAVAHADTKVDLVGLGKAIGAKGRLSFGKPALMTATIGVEAGSVTPFGLINDSARNLSTVILDTALLAYDPVWFHPLENTASTAVSPDDLVKFVEACGFCAQKRNLAAPMDD